MNMKIGYNFGIFVYKQLVSLASLKNKKAKKMIQGHKEIFRYLSENAHKAGADINVLEHALKLVADKR